MTEQTFTDDEVVKILAAKQHIINELSLFWLTAQKVAGEKDFFVSGGCVGSLLREEKVNDIDIYFFSEAQAEPILNLYRNDPSYMFQVAIIEEKYRDVGGRPDGLCITENAITLRSGLQLITKHYGLPDAIRSTFDFVHCMPYYDSRDGKLHISREQYDLNMKKELKINNIKTFTTHRESKFVNRGWKYGY